MQAFCLTVAPGNISAWLHSGNGKLGASQTYMDRNPLQISAGRSSHEPRPEHSKHHWQEDNTGGTKRCNTPTLINDTEERNTIKVISSIFPFPLKKEDYCSLVSLVFFRKYAVRNRSTTTLLRGIVREVAPTRSPNVDPAQSDTGHRAQRLDHRQHFLLMGLLSAEQPGAGMHARSTH